MRGSLQGIRARIERLAAEQRRHQGSGRMASLIALLQDRTRPIRELAVEEEWQPKCALWKAAGWGEPSRAVFEQHLGIEGTGPC